MHRYGRHGAKAWIRRRNKLLHKKQLVPAPQVVVLNVPLEFLSRIQKFVIFMQNGSRLEVEKNVSQTQVTSQRSFNPNERFLKHASDLGQLSAEEDYHKLVDPYASHDLSQIINDANRLYLSMQAHGDQFSTWSTKKEAVADYLTNFTTARLNKLDEISGATTDGTRRLVVIALQDRIKFSTSPSERIYFVRAIMRTYQSLVDDGYKVEDLTEEELLPFLERLPLYHNRYSQDHARNGSTPKEVD